MPEFAYQALDRAGSPVTGVLQGDSPELVADRIRQMGLFPTSVAASGSGRSASAPRTPAAGKGAAATGRVGSMDVVLFTRQLADLVDAGLPLDRALTVLIRQTDSKGLEQRLTRIQEEVRAGRSLSDSLAMFPREFPRLYVNMVHAGEVTGQLGTVMERLAGYLERELSRRSQLVQAMTYPSVLVVVALSAVTFLLTFVVPRLSSVFDDLGHTLPLPTVVLLGVTGFITRYWAWLIGGIALLIGAARWALSTTAGRTAWDGWKLKAPIVGKPMRQIVSSRFVRALGTMLSGGVPILDSLEITREAVGNVVAARAVDRLREAIRQGVSLAEAMEKDDLFLPVAVHMAAVGEETGRLPALLVRTAESLDFEVDGQIRRLLTLVEPVIVLAMGAFVGFIVLSILLPIFEANMAVGQ